MRAILRRFSINAFPLGVKLFIGFMVAVLIPTVIAANLIAAEVAAVNLANLSSYVQEQGRERQTRISEDLDRASQTVESFVDNYSDSLIDLLFNSAERQESLNALTTYVNDTLVTGGDFSRVLILDDGGTVVFSSSVLTADGSVAAVPVGTNRAGSVGFVAADIAATINERINLAVGQEEGRTVVEIAHPVRFQGSLIASVIATVDTNRIILHKLFTTDSFREIESVLTTVDGLLIGAPGSALIRQRPALDDLVQRALGNESDTEVYTVDGSQFVAHYAPITGTPLVILSQSPTNVSFSVTLPGVANRVLIYVGIITAIGIGLALLYQQNLVPPLQRLETSMRGLAQGDFESQVDDVERRDEIGELVRTFVAARNQTRALILDLQRLLDDRVRDLQATQEVSRVAATQRDLQQLMDSVVNRIIDLFPNIYHAQIFLIDDEGRTALLRASTGEAGRKLLARGHRLEVGSVSVIGQVTDEGRVVVARDTAASNVHKANEFLPETRSELAIPLRVGDRIIGALDVQSKLSGSFTGNQVQILQTLADQLAIAIENARLYQETLQRLEEIAESNQRVTQAAWQEYMNAERMRALISEAGLQGGTAVGESDLGQQAIDAGRPMIGEVTDRETVPVAVPIVLRGQTLGTIEWELRAADYSYDKVLLAQELVSRLAVSLDNTRLFQESRRAIDRERLVNEISARLTTQTNIDAILQTAVREIGTALRVPQVNIHLRPRAAQEDTTSIQANGHTNGGHPTHEPER
ncbi:MAG: GAF domain-containing protein [bacterium]|nr:GAF domain-containing protein [bacterium]